MCPSFKTVDEYMWRQKIQTLSWIKRNICRNRDKSERIQEAIKEIIEALTENGNKIELTLASVFTLH